MGPQRNDWKLQWIGFVTSFNDTRRLGLLGAAVEIEVLNCHSAITGKITCLLVANCTFRNCKLSR